MHTCKWWVGKVENILSNLNKKYKDDMAQSSIESNKEFKYSASLIMKALWAHSHEYLQRKFQSHMGCPFAKMIKKKK